MTHPAQKLNALELNGVNLSANSPAGKVQILRDVSLQVATGEAVSIVGPSGSGKTSLIMVIAGLERATSGIVQHFGQDISNWNEDQLARWRRDNVGIVFQSFHLVPTMTALENVAVPLELAGRRDAFEEAEKVLKNVGLGHRLQSYPSTLSGGEQQRVALARAFVVKPKLLLADEPTGNLDQETGAEIVQQMFDLHAEYGTTLLLITHDPALAKRCNRSITIQDGSVA